jgi:hypothetical protein
MADKTLSMAERMKIFQALVDAQDRGMAVAQFEDWHQVAVRSFHQLAGQCEQKGLRLVKEEVDVEVLLRWCAANGLVPDGPARSRFAAEKASKIGPEQSGPVSPSS